MAEQTILISLFAIGAFIVILIAWIIRLELRLRRILRGKDARTLEDTIAHLGKLADEHRAQITHAKQEISSLDAKLKKSIRGISTIRFNPFRDAGGNQSFVTALLTEEGDGVVLSALHARERVSVFAKPIRGYTSSFELSHEEREALEAARSDL